MGIKRTKKGRNTGTVSNAAARQKKKKKKIDSVFKSSRQSKKIFVSQMGKIL